MAQIGGVALMRLRDVCACVLWQAVPGNAGDAQVERTGSEIDRWEPGSDFESSKPAQRAGRRKPNGTASSAPAGRPATPVQAEPSAAGSPVTQSVAGPAKSDRSLNRLEPASCLFLACLRVLQGGLAVESRLATRRTRLEASCLGQNSCKRPSEHQAVPWLEHMTKPPSVF